MTMQRPRPMKSQRSYARARTLRSRPPHQYRLLSRYRLKGRNPQARRRRVRHGTIGLFTLWSPGIRSIASPIRSDTTDDVLQAANCLPDPDKISVGQSLRVPKQPEPREPAATPEPAATQQPFFQGTPTPGATGNVEFTIIVQENATLISEGSFQAGTTNGDVKLGISVSNVTSFEVVRGDGQVLHRGQVVSGSTTAGGNYSFRRIDRAEGSNFLIFTIKALKQDGTTVEGNPVYIRWP